MQFSSLVPPFYPSIDHHLFHHSLPKPLITLQRLVSRVQSQSLYLFLVARVVLVFFSGFTSMKDRMLIMCVCSQLSRFLPFSRMWPKLICLILSLSRIESHQVGKYLLWLIIGTEAFQAGSLHARMVWLMLLCYVRRYM